MDVFPHTCGESGKGLSEVSREGPGNRGLDLKNLKKEVELENRRVSQNSTGITNIQT